MLSFLRFRTFSSLLFTSLLVTLFSLQSASAATPITVSATGAAQVVVSTPVQFTATVTGTENTAVTWSINGQSSATGALGSVSTSGLYTPPATVPSSNWVGITATSQADPTKTSTAWAQIWNQVPTITSATAVVNQPSKLSLDVIGSNFIPSSQLYLSGPQITGYSVTPTVLSSNEMVFTLSYIPQAGSQLTLSVINPNPGKTQSASYNTQVPPAIAVTATGSTQLTVGTPATYTASVVGTPNTAVTWSLKGQAGATGSLGSISADGTYTPPATVPNPNWVGIVATSQLDTTKSATVWAQISNLVPTISSATATLAQPSKLLIDVHGSNFTSASQLYLSGTQIAGYSVAPTVLGSNELTYTLPYVPQAGSQLTLSVINPNPGKTQSAAFNTQVPAAISITATGSTLLTVATGAQYTASVTGSSNTAVSWSIKGQDGATGSLGSISASGLYTPPAAVPDPAWVGITATSQADSTKTSTVWAQISNKVPAIASATVTLGQHQTLLLDVIGSNFIPTSQLYLSGSQITGYSITPVVVSPNEITYTLGYVPKAGSALSLSVINPNPGKTQSSTFNTVVPGAVSVALTGGSTVTVGTSATFTATVTGASNSAVNWSVSGPAGTTAQTLGSISSAGQYTAPATVPANEYICITATSQFDPTKSASLWIQLLNQVPVISAATTAAQSPGKILVNLTGSNFLSNSSVYLQGTRLNTTYVSPTALIAAIATPQTAGSQVAISVVNPYPGKTQSADFNVTLPGHVAVSVLGMAQVQAGSQSQYFSTVTGTQTQGVTWSITSANTDGLSDGTITSDGVYTPPAAISANRHVNIVATSQVDPTQSGTEAITVVGTTTAAAARLLEQSTFGPTDSLIGHVQQVGLSGFIDEQIAVPPTLLPILPNPLPASSPCELWQCNAENWWNNAVSAPDQLRQRVAFTLGEMFVISRRESNDNTIAAYWNNLTNDAFGNWSTIMKDVTLSTGMGEYLNMVNSGKPAPGAIANENFARENLQLFNLGLNLLNQDGTLQTDGLGNPIPAYSESQVEAFARAFTGWTMAPVGGGSPTFPNWRGVFSSPMVAVESKHDMTQKQLLNTTLPAGQTAEQDLDGALTDVFNHSNVAPFVTAQLIRHLVKSNPSPQYVGRVAAVFNNDGNGVRGNMAAVIKAILLDDEARAGDTGQVVGDGYLREPILWTAGVLRALGATHYAQWPDSSAYVGVAALTRAQGEEIFTSPSVFNFFPTDWKVQGTSMAGPEFALETSATIMQKLTIANKIVDNESGRLKIDLSATSPLGVLASASNDALLDELNKLFLHGQMSSAMRTQLSSILGSVSDPAQRVRMAVYLIITSSQYKLVH